MAPGLVISFEMISVSIDPTESHTKAAATKQKYVDLLREPGAEKGWHFLTGEQKSITELAKSLGFHYTYDKASKRYSHASVTYFISPEGRICRYFLSLKEEPEQFKFALNDAGEGKLATSLSDTFVQMCYSYDPLANRYTADARRLLSFAAGAFTLLLLGFTAHFGFQGGRNLMHKTIQTPRPQPAICQLGPRAQVWARNMRAHPLSMFKSIRKTLRDKSDDATVG